MPALGALRLAFATWQELDVPYEVACTRALLAKAYRMLADDDAASRECAAARSGVRPACGPNQTSGLSMPAMHRPAG